MPCGLTKGFGRHRADFYQRHGRPKKLWLKPLHRHARILLGAVDVPAAYAPGVNAHSPERALPIQSAHRAALATALRAVPDPRAPPAVAHADPAPRTEDAKKEGELTAARRLYPQIELNGALVTADARHCEPETLRHIVEHGGDFLVQLKANQPTALAKAKAVAATAAPLLPATRPLPVTAGSTPAGSKSSRWNRWTPTCPTCAA